MSNAPPGSYREALLFVSQLYPGSSLATAPDVPDYPDPVVTHDEEDDLSFDEQTTKSMTFEVGSHEAKLALARWIETKLFVPFLDSTATCYFTGVTIVSDASTQGSGTATPADGAAVDEEDSDEEEEGRVEYDSDGRPFVWRYDADGIRHKRRPGEDSDAGSDEDDEESDDEAEEEEPEPVEDEAGRDLVEIAAIDDRELLDYSDLQTFSHLFKTVDVDKKGAVKHAAIGDHFTPLTSRGINPSQVRQVFECADRHSAGEVTMDQFLDFIGGKPPWYRDWLRHVADTQQAAFLGGMRIGG